MVRLASESDPVRRKIVLSGKHGGYDGARSRPVAVVDGCLVGKPRRPPSIAARRQNQCVAGAQKQHVERGIVAFRVHHARVRTVTEDRFQGDVPLGPGRVVRRHDELDGNGRVGDEIPGGLDEVRRSGNGESVEEVERGQDVTSSDMDSDA